MSILAAAAAALPAVTATSTVAATASAVATASTIASDITSFVSTTVPSMVASVLPSGYTTTSPLLNFEPLNLMSVQFEITATAVGAVSGALIAVRKRFDIIGVVTLAVVAGLGGGIIRDVLLQKYGIAAFQHEYLLWTALVAALIGFFFADLVRSGRRLFLLVDALSLGLFAVIGADKGLIANIGVFAAILLGAITSTGGGIMRDVLTGEVPNVLQPGSLYAAAAVLGSITYVTLVAWLDVVKPAAALVAVLVTLGLRLLSVLFGWSTPRPVDLSPRVKKLVPMRVRRAARKVSDVLPEVPSPPGTAWHAEGSVDDEAGQRKASDAEADGRTGPSAPPGGGEAPSGTDQGPPTASTSESPRGTRD
jgi:uncharacterized membrane protein YeiH